MKLNRETIHLLTNVGVVISCAFFYRQSLISEEKNRQVEQERIRALDNAESSMRQEASLYTGNRELERTMQQKRIEQNKKKFTGRHPMAVATTKKTVGEILRGVVVVACSLGVLPHMPWAVETISAVCEAFFIGHE